jgi:hypothetical protein
VLRFQIFVQAIFCWPVLFSAFVSVIKECCEIMKDKEDTQKKQLGGRAGGGAYFFLGDGFSSTSTIINRSTSFL